MYWHHYYIIAAVVVVVAGAVAAAADDDDDDTRPAVHFLFLKIALIIINLVRVASSNAPEQRHLSC